MQRDEREEERTWPGAVFISQAWLLLSSTACSNSAESERCYPGLGPQPNPSLSSGLVLHGKQIAPYTLTFTCCTLLLLLWGMQCGHELDLISISNVQQKSGFVELEARKTRADEVI